MNYFSIPFLTILLAPLAVVADFDEPLAERLVNFAAATFLDPLDSNTTQMAQSCFKRAYPHSVFSDPQIFNLGACANYIEDECQVLFTHSSDEKLLIIAFRGTVGLSQFKNEAKDSLTDLVVFNPNNAVEPDFGQVNKYFYNAMMSLWSRQNLFNIISDSKYADYTIIFTGHSLGGALASLSALRSVIDGRVTSNRVKVYTFGEPRVGDYALAETMKKYIPDSWRIIHYQDPVPHMPFCSGIFSDFCSKQNKHPYHRPTEIWYHNSNQKMESGDYKQCSGTDGEDSSCSNSIHILSNLLNIIDSKGGDFHNHYYNHLLNEYGPNGCNTGATVGISLAVVLSLFVKLGETFF